MTYLNSPSSAAGAAREEAARVCTRRSESVASRMRWTRCEDGMAGAAGGTMRIFFLLVYEVGSHMEGNSGPKAGKVAGNVGVGEKIIMFLAKTLPKLRFLWLLHFFVHLSKIIEHVFYLI
jgi:hypothetical protein